MPTLWAGNQKKSVLSKVKQGWKERRGSSRWGGWGGGWVSTTGFLCFTSPPCPSHTNVKSKSLSSEKRWEWISCINLINVCSIQGLLEAVSFHHSNFESVLFFFSDTQILWLFFWLLELAIDKYMCFCLVGGGTGAPGEGSAAVPPLQLPRQPWHLALLTALSQIPFPLSCTPQSYFNSWLFLLKWSVQWVCLPGRNSTS